MNKKLKYALYVLAAIVLLTGSFQIVTKYTDSVLKTFEYVTLAVGFVFLIAGIYKYREPLGGTVKDAWEGLGWVRGNLNPLYTITAVFYAVVMVVGLFFLDNTNIKWWIIATTIVVCHFGTSLKVISEKEKAAIMLFGWVLSEADSGLVLCPFPSWLNKFPKPSVRVDAGTIKTDEQRRSVIESADDPVWYVSEEPFRPVWGDIASYTGTLTSEQRESFKDDEYAASITTDPRFYIEFRVWGIRNLIAEIGTLKEAIKRMRDTAASVISNAAGKTFLAKARGEIAEMSELMKSEVEYLVGDPQAKERNDLLPEGEKKPIGKSWGIDILDVRLIDLGIPKRNNEARANRAAKISEADGDARAEIRRSEAAKVKLINEGTGMAAAKTAMNTAEADGILRTGKATAEALAARAAVAETAGGRLIIQSDAVKAGLEHGKAVFLPSGGISDLVSAVVTGVAAIDATKPKPTSPAPSPEERES